MTKRKISIFIIMCCIIATCFSQYTNVVANSYNDEKSILNENNDDSNYGIQALVDTNVEPNVSIGKTAQWVDIENGIAKITLSETDAVKELVDNSDYIIVFDVSGSMPIVTVNGYEPGTYNIDINEAFNIGCKNPNHYSKLKPGFGDDMNGWRNAYHYDNNGTPNNTADDRLLNYSSSTYQQKNWKGEVVQTFYLSSVKDFMYSKSNGCYSSLDTSQRMINNFVDEALKYDANTKFAYVSFAEGVVKTNTFTTGANLKQLVNTSTQYGGTNYIPPLDKVGELLASYNGNKNLKVIFLTDGDNYDSAMGTVNSLKSRYNFEIYSVSADFIADSSSDIYRMGDKYLYVSSSNVDSAVNNFIDYSLNRTIIKATNKVYTDKISEYFEIVNSGSYTLPSNVTESNGVVTWNVPNNTSTSSVTNTTSFYVKLKDEYRKTATETKYKTNLDSATENGAVLTYKIEGGDYNNQTRNISKSSPELPYGLSVINTSKVWSDYDNKYNTRPSSITLNLNKNGTEVDEITISGTSHTFPGYKYVNGQLKVYGLMYDNNSNKVNNVYSVTEDSIENYDITQTGDSLNSYTVENTLNMPSEIEVKFIDNVTKDEISESEHYNGKVGESYTTTPKTIDGYVLYVTPSNVSGDYKVEKTTIVYEYRKLSKVTTKYIDWYTGNELADTEVDTYKEGDPYTTIKKTVDGYTFASVSDNYNGIIGREDIEVVYYYKKNTSVTIKYIDINTNEEIADEVKKIGVQGTFYDSIEKQIEDYKFVRVDGEVFGSMQAEPITITYKYVKQANVYVDYIDEITGNKLGAASPVKYSEGEEYTTSPMDIDGYTLTRSTENANGTMGREDIYVKYYYKKNTSVTVKYIDMVTNEEIADEEIINGLEGQNFETIKKSINGYEFIESEGKTSGQMDRYPTTVTYKYKKNANLITEHIDANTNEKIVDDVVKTYKEGDNYEALAQNFEGYVLVQSPESTTGVMGREDIIKTFYYKKISSGLIVKYVDVLTGELLEQEEYSGNENDVIKLDEKSFKYYVLHSRPEFSEVTLTVEPQEVTYYYIRTSKVPVEGIDQDTREVLYTSEVSGIEGDKYNTVPRDIPGYKLVKIPENQNGIFERENQKVTYEYKKISGKVIVKYVDKETGEELDNYEINGLYGESYETENKTFEDYNFVEVTGLEVGTLSEETKEVTYYYEKKIGKVVVKYVDKEGNEIIREEIEDKVGTEYNTNEKEIKDYVLVEVPENKQGKYVDGTIEVVYVYEKVKVEEKGTIIVNFVDREGNILFTRVMKEDLVGESFYIEAPEIKGYRIIGSNIVEAKFVNGELVFDIVYEKIIEDLPNTGDINVLLYMLIAIFSVTIITKKIIKD